MEYFLEEFFNKLMKQSMHDFLKDSKSNYVGIVSKHQFEEQFMEDFPNESLTKTPGEIL